MTDAGQRGPAAPGRQRRRTAAAAAAARRRGRRGRDDEDAVDVVEAARHDARWRVRQVERVSELVQRRAETRRVVGPVELATQPTNHKTKSAVLQAIC